ncbi:MAG: DUF1684 domain-containing protein [Thermoanaerobaculia bacterium]
MRPRWVLVTLLLAPACGDEAPAPTPAAAPEPGYAEKIESWRADRMERLRRPDGWLSLAGLYWLEEGANTFGADPASDMVFPHGKAEPRLGVLHRTGRQVRLEAAAGAAVAHNGEPVTELDLVSDAGGEPTTLGHGSLRFYVIERGERVGLRLKDLGSELRRSFDGIDHYPVDPVWRLEARFERFAEPKMIPVPNITGDINDQPSHGRVVFAIDGTVHSLESLGKPEDELFLVFGDRTNGDETYGGGRFLYAGPADGEGRLVVDFNKAYNPPCVFTPYATCPLPPPGNRLPVAVLAGEKSFGAGH